MLRKILVPLDGSELAEAVLGFATALSIPTAARLVLVRVVNAHTFPGTDEREPEVRALAEADVYLRSVAARLVARGFSAEIATPYGSGPARWIVDEARLRRTDLIAMSTHGRTGPGRWLFGSVAEAVVAQSPVLVMVQRAWDESRRELLLSDRPILLVPLNSSQFAEAALPVAAGLADDVGGQLVLVRVDTTPTEVNTADADVSRFFDGGEPDRVEAYLEEVASALSEQWPDVEVGRIAQVGDAATSIARSAEASNAALVIMATHGRTGLRRAALGSVAGQVLERGVTPLVLVPPTAANASHAGPSAKEILV